MAATATNSVDSQIEGFVQKILNVTFLEEAFGCVIVHQPNTGATKVQQLSEQMTKILSGLTADQKENALRNYILLVAAEYKLDHLKWLFQVIIQLVNSNVIGARMACEQVLSCDRLVYQNKNFWIESFVLVRKIINLVDYKGVREIMKGCRDKIQSFPYSINLSIMPQMKAVESVIEYIFDRNTCLLPAYFIANEIQKSGPLHWKISQLTSSFVEDFRNIAQMVSIIGHVHMLPIVEHFGYNESLINPWKLDLNTLKFTHRGILPYDPELYQPQKNLLRYVLEQPYSKDMVSSMLNLPKPNKQHIAAIEEQLVWLIISAMERTEEEPNKPNENDDSFTSIHWLWAHISSQLIYFVLLQYASFPNIVSTLHEKLAVKNLRKGRDYLMWSLLQFISGSIQRNPVSNFMSVLSLFDMLYPEKEPLPVPDCTKTYATRQMAPTFIWIHLEKKAKSDRINLHRDVPNSLKKHHEFLKHLMMTNNPLTMGSDFTIVLLCNAYSTNPDYFTRPMAALFETINKTPVGATQPTVPLSMVTLDSLTVHAKMSLIHSIVSHIIKAAQSKNTVPVGSNMAPALVETYSRLLVYTEIESLGIKGFLSQLLPTVFKSQAWGILHTLLEMLSFRMHHIQSFYRVQFLSHLHSLASVPHTNQTQIHLCVESTALRLITGMGSAEVQPQLSRYFTDSKIPGSVVSTESEELNRALILTVAHAMHITGSGVEDQSNAWCKELLSAIMQHTPHSWAPHTLQCFPPILNSFFTQNTIPKENKQLLKKCVDDEYRNWAQMTNENDVITHFTTPGTPPLFLCVLIKMILETDSINSVAYKVLERIGARALSAHLRKLCDYLAFEFTICGQNNLNISKLIDAVNSLMWKYNVVTLDRLVLCLAIRTQEGNEAQVCFYIIQLLLLKSNEFRNQVVDFVRENSPDHWKQSNWHEKHIAFHQKYREKFSPDESVTHNQLPVYFGNLCLRFLPVLDIVIHRFLEVPINNVNKSLESILSHYGCLYKFHDRPVTYLYNTLHFYERKLRDRPALKKYLVNAIIGSLSDIRPANWVLSEQYQTYVQKADSEEVHWQPDISYYTSHVRRIADTISGKNVFYMSDWRFNEFPNAPAHALYVTCVELLSLPVSPTVVANNIIDVIVKGYTVISPNEIHGWINVVGLLLTALPKCYWSVIYDRLQEVLKSDKMTEWPYRFTPFEMFNFKSVTEAMIERKYVLLLAVAHSILHHSSIGQMVTIADCIKEKLKPYVLKEHQLIYVCHLFGPFMLRLDQERPRLGYDLTNLLYELLEQVDKNHGTEPLKYMDSICDLLYHIKYMFVGDMLKNETEVIIRKLRPELQMRLRFISHLSVDEISASSGQKNVPSVESKTQIAPPLKT